MDYKDVQDEFETYTWKEESKLSLITSISLTQETKRKQMVYNLTTEAFLQASFLKLLCQLHTHAGKPTDQKHTA